MKGFVAMLRIVEFDLLDLSDPAADGAVEVVAASGDARIVAVLAQVFGKARKRRASVTLKRVMFTATGERPVMIEAREGTLCGEVA